MKQSEQSQQGGSGGAGPDCERFSSMLAETGKAAADPELAAHVGSCLECFRLMTALRDGSRLQAILLAERGRDAGPLGDPARDLGDAFWEQLPGKVFEEVQRVAAAAPARQAGDARDSGPGDPVLRRFTHWLRRPLPAAFAGACAVALVVLASRLQPSSAGDAAGVAPSISSGAASVASPSVGQEGAGEPEGADDVAELPVPELQALLRGMADDAPQEIRAFLEGIEGREDDNLDDVELGALQRLSALNDRETLRDLARSLGRNAL
jgi:hypothetical protein